MHLTQHFSLEEFACRDGSAYPINQVDEEDPSGRTWLQTRLLPLCQTLEKIRESVGLPITIDSGYRTLVYDQKLYDTSAKDGSVAKPKGSQHPRGRAADIRVVGLTPVVLRRMILGLYSSGQLPSLGGIGLYPTFVHIDVRPRPDNHLAQWGGDRDSNIA